MSESTATTNTGDITTDCCPRCQRAFHCGARDATPCDCLQVILSPATQAALRQTYQGCLCLACLREIAADQSER
jgi:Cysteine-rich CWC